MERAHDLSQQRRTLDVSTDEDINFSDMLLSDLTLKGLEAAGFKKASPIQRKAIPFGRCGFDLIIQAKSGTGKTCVFTVIAMEMLVPSLEKLQIVVLAPTREISVQIANVMSSISRCMGKPKVEAFIGGLPLEQDKKKIAKCQIAVGAPGRMKHLISSGLMDVDSVRLFVLDEADRLMEENFRKDISYIYSKLPCNKQIIAASATFPEELEKFVAEYMKKPIKVSQGEDTILIGVRQFASVIPAHPVVLVQMKNKTAELIKILSTVPFKQCLVFSNYQSRAESMCDELTKQGWPAIFINGSQTQIKRLKAFNSLKEYRCRVLLSTDLTSRGIDAENVNLIVNLDLPYDGATYLHRIGRAGRYGTYGIAVTIVQDGEEVERFRTLLYEIGGENFHVSIFPAEKFSFDIWETTDDQFEKLSSLVGEYKFVKKAEEPSGKKDEELKEEVDGREEEAVSVMRDIRLPPPEKLPVDSLQTLSESLANFKMEDGAVPAIKAEESQDITEVPAKVSSNLMYLENNGWKSFYRELECSRNKCKTTENKPQCVVDDKEGIDNSRFNNAEELSEEDVNNERSDEDEDASDVEGETDDEEDKSSTGTEGETTNSEDCTSEEEDDESDEVSNGESVNDFNDELQNWYSMWLMQSRLIRHYVQYCHYWKDMVNFS